MQIPRDAVPDDQEAVAPVKRKACRGAHPALTLPPARGREPPLQGHNRQLPRWLDGAGLCTDAFEDAEALRQNPDCLLAHLGNQLPFDGLFGDQVDSPTGMLFVVTYGVSTPLAAYGVFLPVLAEHFGWTRGAISAAMSVNLLVGGASGRTALLVGPW